MPRFGLDFALDSLGGGMGGVLTCDYSTYYNGSANVNVDFVDDGSGNMIPATGPIHIREDELDGTLPSTQDLTGDWTIMHTVEYEVIEPVALNYSTRIYTNGGLGEVRMFLNGTGGNAGDIDFNIRDDANVSRFHTKNLAYTLGDKNVIKIQKVGTLVTVTNVTTTESKSGTVDLTTNGCTVDTVQIGYGSATNRMDGYFYELSFTSVSYTEAWNFVGRLWINGDPDENTYTGTQGTVISATDDSPFGLVYPWYNNATSYLVSDTLCAGNNLVTNDGIAVTNNGEFVINTP